MDIGKEEGKACELRKRVRENKREGKRGNFGATELREGEERKMKGEERMDGESFREKGKRENMRGN